MVAELFSGRAEGRGIVYAQTITSSCSEQGNHRELFLEGGNTKNSHLKLWVSIFVTHGKEKELS